MVYVGTRFNHHYYFEFIITVGCSLRFPASCFNLLLWIQVQRETMRFVQQFFASYFSCVNFKMNKLVQSFVFACIARVFHVPSVC